jgi:uncharacterized protein Usg
MAAKRQFTRVCQQPRLIAANALISGNIVQFLRLSAQGGAPHNPCANRKEWNMASKDFRRQLEGYGLTTAQILYRLPDHPSLLQTYVWQDYDLCPRFPVLNRFLAFWLEKLEGPLYSVTVAHSRLIRPAEMRAVNGEFRLH